jgi:hypothetical protein
MKPNIIILFAVVLSLAVSTYAQNAEAKSVTPEKNLPSVKKVLDKYVKAIGGSSAVKKIKSRMVAGTVEIAPMNLKGTFEAHSAPEGKSYSRTSLTGVGDLIEGTDGKTAWVVNPFQGNREKTGAELAQSKLINDFYRDVKLEKLFAKMELKGVEKVGEKDAYVISATAEGVPAETWYFDTKSGLMLRSDVTAIAPEGNQPITFFYEDHRPVDGIMLPFRIRSQTPSFVLTMLTIGVKHGLPVDEAKFARPK